MPIEIKDKMTEIISQVALLAAACEGNLYHEHTITNEAIYKAAVEIQAALIDLTKIDLTA